jgi:hypothetical protein
MTGEHATGSIPSTLAAAPQRVTVLTARATVFAIVAFLAGLSAVPGTGRGPGFMR